MPRRRNDFFQCPDIPNFSKDIRENSIRYSWWSDDFFRLDDPTYRMPGRLSFDESTLNRRRSHSNIDFTQVTNDGELRRRPWIRCDGDHHSLLLSGNAQPVDNEWLGILFDPDSRAPSGTDSQRIVYSPIMRVVGYLYNFSNVSCSLLAVLRIMRSKFPFHTISCDPRLNVTLHSSNSFNFGNWMSFDMLFTILRSYKIQVPFECFCDVVCCVDRIETDVTISTYGVKHCYGKTIHKKYLKNLAILCDEYTCSCW
jgi:hypothetical protein